MARSADRSVPILAPVSMSPEGGGASDRPQRQVRLMPGQRVRPPHVGRSPVPRHVTGTMAHVPSPPRSSPGATVAAAHRAIAPVHGHITALAYVPRAGLRGAGGVTGTSTSGDDSSRSPLSRKRGPSARLRSPLQIPAERSAQIRPPSAWRWQLAPFAGAWRRGSAGQEGFQ